MVKMNSFFKKFFVFFVLFSNFSLFLFGDENSTFYDIVAAENLKSLTEIGTGSTGGLCSDINKIDEQGFKAFLEERFKNQLNPSPQVKRRLVFSLLSRYAKSNPVVPTNVLDLQSWKDLELLCGPKSDPTFHLASKVDRTVTEIGRVILYSKIIQPCSDVKKLLAQQSIVKELVTNETLFKELDLKLNELVGPENIFLSFWDTEDFFALMVQQNKIKIPFDDKVIFAKNFSAWLNKSPSIIQSRSIFRNIFGNVGDALALYGAIALPIYVLTGKSIIPWLPAEKFNHVAPFSTLGALCWFLKEASDRKLVSNNISSNSTSIVASYDAALASYYNIRDFKEGECVKSLFYKKIHDLAKYLNNLKAMVQLVSENKEFAKHFTALDRFNKNLNLLESKTFDLKQLLNILESQTFKDEERGYFHYFGKTIVAYKLMMDLKDSFLDVMVAVGEIDSQLSIAKLYKEFENKRVKFCFPTFVVSANVPSIKAVDFWNPFVDCEKVVPSSLFIGEQYGETQNVIITGPNAAGKSTITKALAISTILAQSLGIAPAAEFEFTPFSKIVAYLNITDDIAAGNSLFKNEVLRARYLIEIVDNLDVNDFAFTIVDEVFKGTSLKEAQAAAKALIMHLGGSSKNICLANTHFPLVPKLAEETGNFTNYKVCVNEDSLGKITCPFKLERGISDQVITLKFLKQEGFGDKFLQDAQMVLDN